MNITLIHHYHPETGGFLGSSEADESPLEPGVFLVPAFATLTPPPFFNSDQQAVWRNEAWSVEEILQPEPEPEPKPEPEPEPAPLTWDDIRSVRNGVLTQCDWTQLADAPLTTEQRAAWASYRQQIRAVPQTFETPEAVVWPSQPTE
jgi:hypothetical protein